MCRILLPLVCLGQLALASTALASGWNESFPSGSLDSYLGEANQSVIVVSAGESTLSAPAAKAIQKALRASSKVKLVMSDESLGAVASLEDSEIVAKASHLPINYVLVVRVFDAAPPTAVIVIYDKTAESVAALSTTRGTVVPAQKAQHSGEGVSEKAAEAVIEIAQEKQRKQYQRQYLWLEKAKDGDESIDWGRIKRGKRGKTIWPAEFYKLIKQPDYLEEFTGELNTRLTFGLLGTIGAVSGTLIGFGYLVEPDSVCSGNGNCTKPIDWGNVGTAFSIGGISALVTLVCINMDSNPVDAVEAQDLIDEYNENLKKKLGLAAHVSPTEPEIKLSFLPVKTADATGVALRLTW